MAFIPSPPGTRVNDVKVQHIDTPFFSGDILVHSIESCRSESVLSPASANTGIGIYDVTSPLAPKVLERSFLNFEVHNVFVYQQGDRAFVLVVEDESERDFHIVDITDPRYPQQVSARGWVDWFAPGADQLALGAAAAPFLHDVWAQAYPDGHDNPALAGRVIAYLAYWDAGLVLLDITDTEHPLFLGDSDYLAPDPLTGEPPEGNSHVAVPTADGGLVFMGDEDFSPVRSSFAVDTGSFAGEYPAVEGGFTLPLDRVADQAIAGPTTFTGLSCAPDAVPPPAAPVREPGEQSIAIVERGVCRFDEKVSNVAMAGYSGAVVFNAVDSPQELFPMQGDPALGTVPAVLVSRSAGFAILGLSPTSPTATPLPPVGTGGERISARGAFFDGWGYGRVLDVRDPSNIVELGRYATENVLAQPVPPGGHSMHNVVLDGQRAYISWYADGIRVVDFHIPERPQEIARFVDPVAGSNFWGVYFFQHPDGKAYVLGSDIDTGLWVLAAP